VHGDYLLRCLQEARHPAGNEEERLGVCLVDLVLLVVVTAPAEACCVTSGHRRPGVYAPASSRTAHPRRCQPKFSSVKHIIKD
jgi:hypothetical protein